MISKYHQSRIDDPTALDASLLFNEWTEAINFFKPELYRVMYTTPRGHLSEDTLSAWLSGNIEGRGPITIYASKFVIAALNNRLPSRIASHRVRWVYEASLPKGSAVAVLDGYGPSRYISTKKAKRQHLKIKWQAT